MTGRPFAFLAIVKNKPGSTQLVQLKCLGEEPAHPSRK